MQGSVSLTRHRMDLMSGLVCALMQVRSVNLRKLACSLPGMAQIDSQYRRLQRFFSSGLSPAVFTQLIVSKLVRPGQPQVLVMDRTHWKLGRTDLMQYGFDIVNSVLGLKGESQEREITPLLELERRHILKVITATNWQVKGAKEAAALLGVPPSTLYGKMRKLGIKSS